MLGQYWPTTVPNAWSEDDSVQSLTNGKDLPYLRNDLVVYCPHVKRKHCLESSWNISSDVALATMKENTAFMTHLNINHVFINMTKLTTAKQDM
eukprot:12912627-Ditylum_brightwellii.AAC.1